MLSIGPLSRTCLSSRPFLWGFFPSSSARFALLCLCALRRQRRAAMRARAQCERERRKEAARRCPWKEERRRKRERTAERERAHMTEEILPCSSFAVFWKASNAPWACGVCVFMCACVRACVRVCVRACVERRGADSASARARWERAKGRESVCLAAFPLLFQTNPNGLYVWRRKTKRAIVRTERQKRNVAASLSCLPRALSLAVRRRPRSVSLLHRSPVRLQEAYKRPTRSPLGPLGRERARFSERRRASARSDSFCLLSFH